MIRRILTHFGGAGRRSGARLFATIADRARENQRWARSRSSAYRVEDFQVHFPDGPRERIRRNATPIAVAAAIVISLALIAIVTVNVTRSQSNAADDVVAAGQFDGPDDGPYAEGSARVGPVDPLDPPDPLAPADGGAQLAPATGPNAGSHGDVDVDADAAADADLGTGTGTDNDEAAPPDEQLAALPARRYPLVVGTGKVTGVYFPAGGAICEVYNDVLDSDSRCMVTSSSGSVENLNALRRGDIDVAVVQSDWQYHAREGSVRLEMPGPFTELRALFSIYVEPLTILARRDSGIVHVDDLRGRRVAMGAPDSASYEAMKALMSAMNWSSTDFAALNTEPSSQYLEALCLGEVDAAVTIGGHPNGTTMNITNACDTRLVDISGDPIDAAVAATPYFAKATIPGGYYPGNPDPVASFGVAATVVVDESLPEDIAYDLVSAVFDHFDTFRTLHPAFLGLSEADMVSRALSAPLHRGAIRYYHQRGWM